MPRMIHPSTRFGVITTLAIGLALVTAGCKNKNTKKSGEIVTDRASDGGVHAGLHVETEGTDGGATELSIREGASAFQLVSTLSAIKLRRIEKGPVLAASEDLRVLYTLERDGSIGIVEPFSRMVNENYRSMGMQLGRIAGVWPENLFVELAEPGGRSETIVVNHNVNVAKGTVTVARRSGHLAYASSWRDGSILASEAESSSLMGPYVLGRPSELVVITTSPGAKKPRAPKWPKQAAALDGEVIAYESGRIFLQAGLRPPRKPNQDYDEDPPDTAYIFDSPDGVQPPAPVKMPGPVEKLVRGRVETETIAFGASWMSRFNGDGWVAVPLPPVNDPTSVKLTDVTIGDDGSVWVIAGGSDVFRGDLPALAWKPVGMPSGFTAHEILARDATDVWIAGSAKEDSEPYRQRLLHTQAKPRSPLFTFPDSPEKLAEQFLNDKGRDFTPFSRSCMAPFIVFGTDAEITEEEAKALAAKKIPEAISGKPVLAKSKDGKVYGFVVDESFSETYLPIVNTTSSIKAVRPSARVVCARPTVEKDLSPPPKTP